MKKENKYLARTDADEEGQRGLLRFSPPFFPPFANFPSDGEIREISRCSAEKRGEEKGGKRDYTTAAILRRDAFVKISVAGGSAAEARPATIRD